MLRMSPKEAARAAERKRREAAEREAAWGGFTWDDWVPQKVRDEIERFWGCWGRNPAKWQADVRPGTPEYGSRVRDSESFIEGRFIHCWNNMGRIVDDSGKSWACSTGSSGGVYTLMHRKRGQTCRTGLHRFAECLAVFAAGQSSTATSGLAWGDETDGGLCARARLGDLHLFAGDAYWSVCDPDGQVLTHGDSTTHSTIAAAMRNRAICAAAAFAVAAYRVAGVSPSEADPAQAQQPSTDPALP